MSYSNDYFNLMHRLKFFCNCGGRKLNKLEYSVIKNNNKYGLHCNLSKSNRLHCDSSPQSFAPVRASPVLDINTCVHIDESDRTDGIPLAPRSDCAYPEQCDINDSPDGKAPRHRPRHGQSLLAEGTHAHVCPTRSAIDCHTLAVRS